MVGHARSLLVTLGVLMFFSSAGLAQSERAQQMMEEHNARVQEMRDRHQSTIDEFRAKSDARFQEMQQRHEAIRNGADFSPSNTSSSDSGSNVRIRGRTIKGALILLGLLGAGAMKVFGFFGGGSSEE